MKITKLLTLGITMVTLTTACAKDNGDTKDSNGSLVYNNYNCNSLYQDRVNFGAKFEPKGNYVIHGAGQDQSGIITTFNNYVETVGDSLTPAITMGYVAPHHLYNNWAASITNSLTKYNDDSKYLMLQVGVHFNKDENPDEAYYDKIANGEMDTEVKGVINVLKNLKRPVFCRPGFEFNGEWNGYKDPEIFKKAFKRFYELVQECNATNIALVWCMNPDAKNKNVMDYYPGDEYVDWFGIDIFRIGSAGDPITKNFILQANLHHKPVMICEATPFTYDVTKGQGWNEWFVKYFNFIKNNPVIKAACYINWHWTNYPQWSNWGDARLEESTDEIKNNYKNELNDPIFLHSKPKAEIGNYIYDFDDIA